MRTPFIEPLSILIIDDSDADRHICSLAVRNSCLGKVSVREAATGSEGIRLAKEERPGCILLDFMLPDMDGLEVLNSLRDQDGEPMAPIVMLTGQGDEKIAARAMQGGAQDYVVKGSFNLEGLSLAIVGARSRFFFRKKEVAQREEFRTFAHAAAHDLKAPLRRAGAFADILSRIDGDKLTSEEHGAVSGVARSIEKMQMMVESLLAFARCGSGVPSAKPTPLEQVVRQALSNLSSSFDLEQANIVIGRLPTVPGDEGGLTILLQNLLSNALKFTQAKRPEITIQAELKAPHWIIRVQDNGIGISPEHLEDIFVPLRRLHSDQDYEGTGLGLATCRRVAEHHNWSISCESEIGSGSAFIIRVPAEGCSLAPNAPRPHGFKEGSSAVNPGSADVGAAR